MPADPADAPRFVANRKEREGDRHQFARLRPPHHLGDHELLPAEGRLEGSPRILLGAGRHEELGRAPENLGGRVPVQHLRPAVPEDDAPFAVPHDDRVLRRLDDGRQAEELPLTRPLLRDVADDAEHLPFDEGEDARFVVRLMAAPAAAVDRPDRPARSADFREVRQRGLGERPHDLPRVPPLEILPRIALRRHARLPLDADVVRIEAGHSVRDRFEDEPVPLLRNLDGALAVRLVGEVADDPERLDHPLPGEAGNGAHLDGHEPAIPGAQHRVVGRLARLAAQLPRQRLLRLRGALGGDELPVGASEQLLPPPAEEPLCGRAHVRVAAVDVVRVDDVVEVVEELLVPSAARVEAGGEPEDALQLPAGRLRGILEREAAVEAGLEQGGVRRARRPAEERDPLPLGASPKRHGHRARVLRRQGGAGDHDLRIEHRHPLEELDRVLHPHRLAQPLDVRTSRARPGRFGPKEDDLHSRISTSSLVRASLAAPQLHSIREFPESQRKTSPPFTAHGSRPPSRPPCASRGRGRLGGRPWP